VNGSWSWPAPRDLDVTDLVSIKRYAIDAWADILNFTDTPAPLLPITVNTGDRDLIRITPYDVTGWGSIVTVGYDPDSPGGALPAPLPPITVNTGGSRDLIGITPYNVEEWGALVQLGGDSSDAGAMPPAIEVIAENIIGVVKQNIISWNQLLTWNSKASSSQDFPAPVPVAGAEVVAVTPMGVADWSELITLPSPLTVTARRVISFPSTSVEAFVLGAVATPHLYSVHLGAPISVPAADVLSLASVSLSDLVTVDTTAPWPFDLGQYYRDGAIRVVPIQLGLADIIEPIQGGLSDLIDLDASDFGDLVVTAVHNAQSLTGSAFI